MDVHPLRRGVGADGGHLQPLRRQGRPPHAHRHLGGHRHRDLPGHVGRGARGHGDLDLPGLLRLVGGRRQPLHRAVLDPRQRPPRRAVGQAPLRHHRLGAHSGRGHRRSRGWIDRQGHRHDAAPLRAGGHDGLHRRPRVPAGQGAARGGRRRVRPAPRPASQDHRRPVRAGAGPHDPPRLHGAHHRRLPVQGHRPRLVPGRRSGALLQPLLRRAPEPSRSCSRSSSRRGCWRASAWAWACR